LRLAKGASLSICNARGNHKAENRELDLALPADAFGEAAGDAGRDHALAVP